MSIWVVHCQDSGLIMEIEAPTDYEAEEIATKRMDVDIWPDEWQLTEREEPTLDDIVAQAADIDVNPGNRVGYIIDYESGDLSAAKVVALFQHLVNTGLAWQFQGCYGRMAASLIEAGLVSA